jgi:hypothetical protein
MSSWVIGRVLEGNKALARSVNKYLKDREKITAYEWRTNIKPLITNLQEQITRTLKDKTLPEWKVTNLKNIQNELNRQINNFAGKLTLNLTDSQLKLIDFTEKALDKQNAAVGLDSKMRVILTEEKIASLKPLTETIVTFLEKDIAQDVSGIVTRGLIGGKTVAEVTKEIAGRFESSDTMSLARAERIANTEMLRASSFTEMQRAQEISQLNPSIKKIWISSHKPDSRENHLECEAKYINDPIGIDEPFIIPGYFKGKKYYPEESCQYPRDPALSASNSVYCGCSMVTIDGNDTDFMDSMKNAV